MGIAEAKHYGHGARFEIRNGCKFYRSDVELYLAQVYFDSEWSARIQTNCVKVPIIINIIMPHYIIAIQGVHIYNRTSTTKKNTSFIKLNSANVNFDLNGANCSFTGCYNSDAVYTIPDKSCVIGKCMHAQLITTAIITAL